MDWENEVSRMFIISLSLENRIDSESISQSQAVHAVEYAPLNQPITVHFSLRDIIKGLSLAHCNGMYCIGGASKFWCNGMFHTGDRSEWSLLSWRDGLAPSIVMLHSLSKQNNYCKRKLYYGWSCTAVLAKAILIERKCVYPRAVNLGKHF